MLCTVGKGNRHVDQFIMVGVYEVLTNTGNSGLNNLKVYDLANSHFQGLF